MDSTPNVFEPICNEISTKNKYSDDAQVCAVQSPLDGDDIAFYEAAVNDGTTHEQSSAFDLLPTHENSVDILTQNIDNIHNINTECMDLNECEHSSPDEDIEMHNIDG